MESRGLAVLGLALCSLGATTAAADEPARQVDETALIFSKNDKWLPATILSADEWARGSSEDLANGTAWARFTQRIGQVGARIQAPQVPDSALDRERRRHLAIPVVEELADLQVVGAGQQGDPVARVLGCAGNRFEASVGGDLQIVHVDGVQRADALRHGDAHEADTSAPATDAIGRRLVHSRASVQRVRAVHTELETARSPVEARPIRASTQVGTGAVPSRMNSRKTPGATRIWMCQVPKSATA
jgi:hypothetical protein